MRIFAICVIDYDKPIYMGFKFIGNDCKLVSVEADSYLEARQIAKQNGYTLAA